MNLTKIWYATFNWALWGSWYYFFESTFNVVYTETLKQCVSVKNIKSAFEEIISGVSQVSIVRPILFNILFNDFLYFIFVASAHNFADINTLSSFTITIENLISILESEKEIAINWFKDNHMSIKYKRKYKRKISAKPGNSKTQSSHFWNKKRKEYSSKI